MELLRKYGAATDIYFPLVDAGTNNFAGSGDFTHAAGDTKISKDGAAAGDTTNAPLAIAMGNASIWKLTLTATEMQAAKIMITVSDAATKAVEDQMIIISTYGNALAEHAFDLDLATQSVTVSDKTGFSIAGTKTTLDGLNDLTAAQVNAEVVDALTVDTIAELAQAVPPATPTLAQAVMLLYMALRNKIDVTATLKEIHNDAGTVITKKTLSDDGTTYSETEMVSGP